MASHQSQSELNVSVSVAVEACESVIAGLGWKLSERSAYRLVVKEPFLNSLVGNPATVSIHFVAQSSDRTIVEYSGSNFGFGPLNTDRIKKAITTVQQRLQAEVLPMIAVRTATQEGLLCPTCGSLLQPGTKFCPNDGTAIAKVCPKCGNANAPSASFCSNCGQGI